MKGYAIGLGVVALVGLLWLVSELPSTWQTSSIDEPSMIELVLGGETLIVDVADTPRLRTRGLSGRPSLPEGQGMLFVFDEPNTHGFWMPDMHFSIDIMWFDQEKQVVHIEHGVAPETYPESFSPPTPALYVLEVPAGWSREHGISVGDRATW